MSKVTFINKREGLQRNSILCLKKVWRQNVVFRIILPRKFSLNNIDINSQKFSSEAFKMKFLIWAANKFYMFKFVSGLVCRTSQLWWKKIADARKTTEKVVRAQASQEISYRALNNQQNGLEVSKVIFINKREGLQRNTILCLKQVWRQTVVFRMIFCLENLV